MKHPSLYLLLVLCLLFVAVPVWAAEEASTATEDEIDVVVTATRTATPVEQVASSITIVTEEQIKATKEPFVADVLREVPGVFVTQTGGPGRQVDVFLRGAGPGHTLVLLDGVELNDPISGSRAFDLANLTVDNIARIEVLRGPQSTLYGSDAMAGVINIITKRGSGQPKTDATLSAGSFSTGEGRLNSSGSVRGWNYSFSGSRFSTNGFSVASEARGNTEDDGYANTTLSTRLGRQVSDSFAFDLIGRYTKGKADLDGWNYATNMAGDDLAYVYDTEQTTLRAEGRWRPGLGKWEHIFGWSSNVLDRAYENNVGAGETGSADYSTYSGKSRKLDWQGNYTPNAQHLLTLGAETETDKGSYTTAYGAFAERDVRTTGYYAQDQLTLRPNWFATVGVRLDDHEIFGSETTYRVTSTYHLAEHGPRLKATYGTGFKAPALYQLYDPSYGNANLQPEESTGWDAGIEQEFFAGRAALSATYFHNDFDNLIQWTLEDPNTFAGHYQNVSSAKTHGVELVASYRPSNTLHINLNYTHTDTEGPDGQPLSRRPRHQYGADAIYRWTPKLQMNLRGVHVGSRLDGTVNLPSYTTVNLATTYTLSSTMRAYLRIDNLFDEDYEEVYGYGTAGRSLTGGLTYSF